MPSIITRWLWVRCTLGEMIILFLNYFYLTRRDELAQGCDYNATVVGSIPIGGTVYSRGNDFHKKNYQSILFELLFLNIFISSLWHEGKSPALSSTT